MDETSLENLLGILLVTAIVVAGAVIYVQLVGVPWFVTAPVDVLMAAVSVGKEMLAIVTSNILFILGALFFLGVLFSEE